MEPADEEIIRVVVVNDGQLVESGLRAVLAAVTSMEVTAADTTTPSCGNTAPPRRPDVLLLNVRLRDPEAGQPPPEALTMAGARHPWASRITGTVVEGFTGVVGHAQAAKRAIHRLTDREREVVALLGHGLSNAEIAEHMHLAHGTVKDHVSAILGKLGGVNRVQAAVLAERAGLIMQFTVSSADGHRQG